MHMWIARKQSMCVPVSLFRTVSKHPIRSWIGRMSHHTSVSAARQTLPSTPISIKVSLAERASSQLSQQNVELAVRALHRDGLVLLEDAVAHSELDNLGRKMVDDALVLQARGDSSPYNYNKGNIQQDPPAVPAFFSPQIFLNPFATQITSSVLGPRPQLSFLSGNTALPRSTQAQPTHSDADFDHPDCPFGFVVNVPLITMTPENGSTEVWLGTHSLASVRTQEGKRGERSSGRIKEDLLAKRRQVRPPSQPIIPKGGVVIRDLRLWHGGMPNRTDQVRVMLAMIHFAPWYRNAMQVEMAQELKDLVEAQNELNVQASWVTEEEIMQRYLNRGFGNSYNFDQEDKLQLQN